MFCAAWWVSIKFSTFNQGCATTFMRSPLAPIKNDLCFCNISSPNRFRSESAFTKPATKVVL